jgi:4-hydroxybenzoate polyprenyltransferase
MITTTQMYWLTRCDPIKEFLVGIDRGSFFLTGLCVIAAMILAGVATFAGNGSYEMFSGMDDASFDKLKGSMRKWAKRLGALGIALWLISTAVSTAAALTPTTKEMAAIMVIPKVANSKVVSDISGAASEMVTIARDWLKELAPVKGDAK